MENSLVGWRPMAPQVQGTTLVASSSPDAIKGGAADHFSAHISPFLLHIRQRGADMAVDPALGAATPAHTAPSAVTAPPAVDMDTGTGASAVDGTAQSDAIPASADASAAADDARGPAGQLNSLTGRFPGLWRCLITLDYV